MTPLLEKIQATDDFPVPTFVVGREELNKTLIDLNDIIRLHSRINQPEDVPPKDVLSEIKEVPRIETPFWKSSKEHHSELLGNLVIVDTPGPNEAGKNLNLAAVVEEQLRQSSIVLIVIDFTSLNSEAAVEVKEQVQPIVELLGQENLYVLVNKIDQRREDKSMTPEEVRRFVAAHLGLGDSSDVERVFEVSARRAFAAANFMQEIEQCSEVVFTEMKSARSLAEEVFSATDWKEDLEAATLAQLKNSKDSGAGIRDERRQVQFIG